MVRSFLLIAVFATAVSAWGDDLPETPLVERYLHEGKFAEGETALLLALDARPEDDEVRFGLGAILFVRAIDNLGKTLYEYGAISENASQPFLRLPVPKNDRPSSISYRELGRALDAFASDLARAEIALAGVTDENVKLRLRLARITFDFAGTGENRSSLLELLVRANGGRLDFEEANPDFRVHFDRGDVAWLRAYCHLMCAMVEGYRAFDEESGFVDRVKDVFPRVEDPHGRSRLRWTEEVQVVDPPRLRRMRLHLVAVCELNRETWSQIRKESDDDYEWLPKPTQTDQLGLPLTDERIDGWLLMMAQWEEVLKGERLVSRSLLSFVVDDVPDNRGLNVKTLLNDPPSDMFSQERLREKGIHRKYLEVERGRLILELNAIIVAAQLFQGPFGFAYAVRMN